MPVSTDGGDGGSGGGLWNAGRAVIDHCTIAGNQAGAAGTGGGHPNSIPPSNGTGGGLANVENLQRPKDVYIKNTLISDNYAVDVTSSDCSGTLRSRGYNLIRAFTPGTDECELEGDATGNLLGLDAWLAPLADYGGPTWTHGLYKFSPAIDAGTCTDLDLNVVVTDQRGEPRPQIGGCDIGAYEASLTEFHYLVLPILRNGSPRRE